MSGIFGTNGKGSQAFQLTGGGANAPWNWGVSPFDQSMIDQATTSNTEAMTNRYNQLGLGGSTMEGQDLAQTALGGEAMTGQLQTANEANPALNPAEQPPINNIVGNLNSNSLSSSLGSLASAAGSSAGLGNVASGIAGLFA